MSGCNLKSLMLAGAITVGIVAQPQAQDVANGEHLFRIDCSVCHSPQPVLSRLAPFATHRAG